MKKPNLSKHFQDRLPSAIRSAQILFSDRKDKENIKVINLSIGNISLPMYPAMKKIMDQLGKENFSDGVIKYTPTAGTDNARKSFINIKWKPNVLWSLFTVLILITSILFLNRESEFIYLQF